MTSIEHREIRGITIKNIIVTVISTASICITVMTTYFQLQSDINSNRSEYKSDQRIVDLRLRAIEDHQKIIDQQMAELNYDKKK